MRVRHLCLFCILLLSSCANNIYTPALFGHDIAYQPKPMTQDTKKNSNYISGTYAQHQTINTDDVSFGELNLSRAHAYKNGNLALGVFGFAGRIKNGSYSSDSASKYRFRNLSFEGVGVRASGNFTTSFGRTDWRFLGFEAAYSKEFGAYTNFRRAVAGYPGYYSTLNSSLFNVGLTTEIIWHGRSNIENQYGFRVYLGRTFGDLSYLTNPISGSSSIYAWNGLYSIFMQLHHMTGKVEIGGGIASIVPGARLTLGYRF